MIIFSSWVGLTIKIPIKLLNMYQKFLYVSISSADFRQTIWITSMLHLSDNCSSPGRWWQKSLGQLWPDDGLMLPSDLQFSACHATYWANKASQWLLTKNSLMAGCQPTSSVLSGFRVPLDSAPTRFNDSHKIWPLHLNGGHVGHLWARNVGTMWGP